MGCKKVLTCKRFKGFKGSVQQVMRVQLIARFCIEPHDTTKRADEIARELGVGYFLETSLRRIDNRVRVTVQLVDARTQGHLWAEQYERDALDPLALQRELTVAVSARRLSSLDVSVRTRDSGAERHSNDSAAYEHYLRGRYHCAKRHDRRTAESAG